jgi:RNA polymerase sigma-70 factor (ECF subfamily)
VKAIGKVGENALAESDDQRLLKELRNGRREACAELIRVHYQTVYRFLVHLTRDVHEAEDLTQETFAAAWTNIPRFQGRASLATWLHRIAYTRFVDGRRAGRRALALADRLLSPGASPADPLDIVAADDEAQQLYGALYQLDPEMRAPLVLHYLQGLSYREMAGVLREPTGTVKWRTCEALVRLRALWNSEVRDHARR